MKRLLDLIDGFVCCQYHYSFSRSFTTQMQESVDVKDSESPSLLVCKKNRRNGCGVVHTHKGYSYDVRSRSHTEVLRKEDSVHQSGETDSEEPNITSQVQKKIPMNQRRSYSGDLSYERIHRDSNGM